MTNHQQKQVEVINQIEAQVKNNSLSFNKDFKDKIEELSSKFSFEPYEVDSVSLITANAVLKKLQVIQTWKLG